MRQLLKMWRDQFGYVPLTLAEAEALEGRIVSPDSDSAQLLKKILRPRCVRFLPIPIVSMSNAAAVSGGVRLCFCSIVMYLAHVINRVMCAWRQAC